MVKKHCFMCGHNWDARVSKPDACPKCHSTYYWSERRAIKKYGKVR